MPARSTRQRKPTARYQPSDYTSSKMEATPSCQGQTQQTKEPTDYLPSDPDLDRLREPENYNIQELMKSLEVCPDGGKDGYYLVHDVVARRRNGRGGFEFRLRWAGYSPTEDTWEPFKNLNPNLQEVVRERYTLRGKKSERAELSEEQIRSIQREIELTNERSRKRNLMARKTGTYPKEDNCDESDDDSKKFCSHEDKEYVPPSDEDEEEDDEDEKVIDLTLSEDDCSCDATEQRLEVRPKKAENLLMTPNESEVIQTPVKSNQKLKKSAIRKDVATRPLQDDHSSIRSLKAVSLGSKSAAKIVSPSPPSLFRGKQLHADGTLKLKTARRTRGSDDVHRAAPKRLYSSAKKSANNNKRKQPRTSRTTRDSAASLSDQNRPKEKFVAEVWDECKLLAKMLQQRVPEQVPGQDSLEDVMSGILTLLRDAKAALVQQGYEDVTEFEDLQSSRDIKAISACDLSDARTNRMIAEAPECKDLDNLITYPGQTHDFVLFENIKNAKDLDEGDDKIWNTVSQEVFDMHIEPFGVNTDASTFPEQGGMNVEAPDVPDSSKQDDLDLNFSDLCPSPMESKNEKKCLNLNQVGKEDGMGTQTHNYELIQNAPKSECLNDSSDPNGIFLDDCMDDEDDDDDNLCTEDGYITQDEETEPSSGLHYVSTTGETSSSSCFTGSCGGTSSTPCF